MIIYPNRVTLNFYLSLPVKSIKVYETVLFSTGPLIKNHLGRIYFGFRFYIDLRYWLSLDIDNLELEVR